MYPQQDYTPQHGRPPRKHHPFRWLLLAVLAVVVFVTVLVAVSVSRSGVSKVSTAGTPSVAPKGSHSAASDTPPVDNSTNGTVGDSFTVSAQNDNGNQVTYRVKLTKVDAHAELGPYETTDNPKAHMEAARFTITGITGQANDDALSNALGITGSTDTITPSLNDVTDGGTFNAGSWNVGPGQSVSGWVPFEVPPGQHLASVQWVPDAGMGSATATWRIP